MSYILLIHNVRFYHVNTHKNCAGVYWNISVSGLKLLGCSDDVDIMVEGKTEVLTGKRLIFDHCAFFCMPIYAPCMWPRQSALCASLFRHLSINWLTSEQ